MYKIFIFISFSFFLFSCQNKKETISNKKLKDEHTSQLSLDWDGIYKGISPCNHCEGLLMSIRLKNDLTYQLITQHSGDETMYEKENGTFVWNDDGNTIRFQDKNGKTQTFLVTENIITLIQNNSHAMLYKELYGIKEQYWKLIELNEKAITGTDSTIREPYIILKDSDNELQGFASCNRLKGIYSINDVNKISFSNILTTRVTCNLIKQETEFINTLSEAKVYRIENDKLLLLNNKHKIIARFQVVYLR